MAKTSIVSRNLYGDRHWKSLLYLFSEHSKLSQYLTPKYIDFDNGIVDISALIKTSEPWSPSEKFMLELALYLFNPSNKFDLGGMDTLDSYNMSLALTAIELRYG